MFRASPLSESAIIAIIPLGNLNPPGHTLPTDHIYLNVRRPNDPPTAPIEVDAPADGIVQYILRNGVEAKIGVRVGTATYYLDHIVLDATIHEGMTLTAGQRLGQTGDATLGIDLGVVNDQKTNSFLNPSRYPPDTLHGDAPLRFFEEPLRSRLYSRVQSVGSNRDGNFAYDVEGRLVGNWFLEGLPPAASSTSAAWPQHLAFVFDNYDPGSIRISIGGTLSVVGVFTIPADAPPPSAVSTSNGKVAYSLLFAGAPGTPPSSQRALMIVQMLAADRIRVEVVDSTTARDAEFSASAQMYVR